MELKKSTKANLETKKGLFLEIGLVISILLVIATFSYSQAEKIIEIIPPEAPVVEAEIVAVTRQEERPPIAVTTKPVQVVSDIMNIVENDTEITQELTFADFDDEAVFASDVSDYGIGGGVDEIVDDAPFVKVEQMPSFQGGDLTKFRNWVQKKVVYPRIAEDNGIQGRVTVTFIVEKDGTITDIKQLQSPDKSLTQEVIRILNSSPKWTPGKQSGKTVRVTITLPIIFKIAR